MLGDAKFWPGFGPTDRAVKMGLVSPVRVTGVGYDPQAIENAAAPGDPLIGQNLARLQAMYAGG
jgi:hypothetical protein